MERTVKVLNQMKSERVILNYALGGAVAALFYMEPIETHDLDVFISLPQGRLSPSSALSTYRPRGTFQRKITCLSREFLYSSSSHRRPWWRRR